MKIQDARTAVLLRYRDMLRAADMAEPVDLHLELVRRNYE